MTLDRSYPMPDPAPGTKHIPLGHGEYTIVDAADYDDLSKHLWCIFTSHGKPMYAQCRIKGKTILLHRYLLPNSEEVDHINRNGLDNRRCNLRSVTTAQNQWNTGLRRLNTSGVKGVHWHKGQNKWQATIRINNKKKYLGCYDDKEKAKDAYEAAVQEIRGYFLNPKKDTKNE